ncbi:hypothetical protein Ciccas_012571, partial [Cichlidogyrus casuarinus]
MVKQPSQIDYDLILRDTYGWGFYQFLLLLSVIGGTIFGSMEWASVTFMNQKVSFTCNTTSDVTWISKDSYDSLQNRYSFPASSSHAGEDRPEIKLEQEQCWGLVGGNRSETFACTDFVFDPSESVGMKSTLVSEFGLVCDRANYPRRLDELYILSVATGHLIIGLLERFGRQKLYFIVIIGILATQVGMTQ